MTQKIILFGASKLGILAYEYLKDRYNICYYCDNDINKAGKSFNGIEIISIQKLKELVKNQDYLIIISSQYYKEIGEQLISIGIDKKKFRVFYNSLEYLQTIYDIEEKKEDMKSSIKYEDVQYNRGIFSKYNVHLMIDSIYTKTFIEIVNDKHDGKRNIFIIVNNSGKVKYLDAEMYSNLEILDINDYSTYSKLYTYIYGCQKLFIHFLSDMVCEVLDRYDISRLPCTIYWALWGADLYSYIDFNMYEEKTYEFIRDKAYYTNAEKYRKDPKKMITRRKVIEDLDYILTWNKGDYELAIQNFDTKAKRKHFSYNININYNDLIKIKETDNQNFRNKCNYETLFFVGNSATFANNHIDVFYKIKELEIDNYRVILPLSYGNKEYAKDIINEAKRILGDKIIPLQEFLDPYTYYDIMNQSDVVIMNHIRQQGVGNILGALYMGNKVFINKKSNVYDFLVEEGFGISRIEDLDKDNMFKKDDINIIENRRKIKELFSNDYTDYWSSNL